MSNKMPRFYPRHVCAGSIRQEESKNISVRGCKRRVFALIYENSTDVSMTVSFSVLDMLTSETASAVMSIDGEIYLFFMTVPPL